MNLDVAIVGNGAIGTLTAIKLKLDFPSWKIALIGNTNRHNSASTAAGAMVAVFGEIECATSTSQSHVQERFFQIGLESSEKWRKFLLDSKGEHTISAQNTLLFLKKTASNFEQKNFESATSVAMSHDRGSFLSTNIPASKVGFKKAELAELFEIQNEFALCTFALFKHLDDLRLNLGIEDIPFDVSRIDLDSQTVFFKSIQPGMVIPPISAKRIVLAAGAMTESLIPQSGILQMFQGVGGAFLIDHSPLMESLQDTVVRSVNRGGAQCGIHTVPRTDGKIYLGAGNFVTRPGNQSHRLDTLNYLLSTFESDLASREAIYQFSGNLVLGMRPRSLDGLPMIGPLTINENIFVATACNRLGLTWSSLISESISSYFRNSNFPDLFSGWSPDRDPISYGDLDAAIQYFSESRVGNAVEHGLIDPSRESQSLKMNEFEKVGLRLLKEVNDSLGITTDVIIHPDNWGAVLSS